MEKRNRFVNKYEFTTSLIFILLGLILFIYIIPSQISGAGDIPNARTLPYAFAVLLTLLSVAWAVDSFLNHDNKVHDGVKLLKGAGVGFLLLVLGMLVEVLGFLPAGCVAIICVALMIHPGKVIPLAIFSVCVTVLYYFFFWKLLYISFPKGWFFT